MDWKLGDWVVFDLKVGQITQLRENGSASFSDGFMETSGRVAYRFRQLTLRNKRIVETFDIFYRRLYEIDGSRGFNYPDISSYFSQLALAAIDHENNEKFFEAGQAFAREARDYKSVIHGVRLFRPERRSA